MNASMNRSDTQHRPRGRRMARGFVGGLVLSLCAGAYRWSARQFRTPASSNGRIMLVNPHILARNDYRWLPCDGTSILQKPLAVDGPWARSSVRLHADRMGVRPMT